MHIAFDLTLSVLVCGIFNIKLISMKQVLDVNFNINTLYANVNKSVYRYMQYHYFPR